VLVQVFVIVLVVVLVVVIVLVVVVVLVSAFVCHGCLLGGCGPVTGPHIRLVVNTNDIS